MKIHGLPMGIGSMPHVDHQSACEFILDTFPRSPFFPELPKRSWRESMGIEQARAIPGFIIDDQAQRAYFDNDKDISSELESFYESYLIGDDSSFGVSNDFLPGLSSLLKIIESRDLSPDIIKGQLTGPTTLGLILKDKENRATLFDDQIMDVLVKATGMKARWMASKFREYCDSPIIFFDEPMLQSIGSATVQIERDTAVSRLSEIVEMAGCLTGGHCCGNTDWSILMEAGMDVVAFDAWEYAETITLYPEALAKFLERGGYLAWGIVPASELGAEIKIEVLFEKFSEWLEKVAQAGHFKKDELLNQSIITPSCGLGSLSKRQAETILQKTSSLNEKIFDN